MNFCTRAIPVALVFALIPCGVVVAQDGGPLSGTGNIEFPSVQTVEIPKRFSDGRAGVRIGRG